MTDDPSLLCIFARSHEEESVGESMAVRGLMKGIEKIKSRLA